MHIPESAFRSNEFSVSVTRVFVADIACILCARTVGTAIDVRWPPVTTVLIQMDGSKILRRIELRRLRCACGGNTAATEVTTRLLRREGAIDWRREQPRRGRPPKWLVAERAARAAGSKRPA